MPLPRVKECVFITLFLVTLLIFHIWLLHKGKMSLSTTPFIDPAGVIQVTAWDLFSYRCFQEGIFPLWNPYTGLGQPHLANLQTAVFYPLKLFFYPWGSLWSHDLYLYVRFILLGLGIFVLGRSMGIGKIGSVFSASAFACGGYVLWFINLVELNNQLLTPFLMIALTRLGSGFSWKRFLATSVLLFVDILGGHPEGIFVTVLFSSLFALWMLGLRRLPYAVAVWSCAAITGTLASAIVFIPFVEYFTKTWNFHFAGMGFLHLGLKAPFTLISPYFSSAVGGPLPTLPENLSNMSLYDFFKLPYLRFQLNAGFPYLGVIVLSMALTAIFNLRKLSRAAGFFIVFWLVCMALSMGLLPFNLLGFIPPFNVTNNAKFYFAEITFCACVMGGIGLEFIEQQKIIPLMFLCFFIAIGAILKVTLQIEYPHILFQLLPALSLVFLLVFRKSSLMILGKLFLKKSVFQSSQRTNKEEFLIKGKRIKLLTVLFLLAELAVMRQTVKPYLPLEWRKVEALWLKEIEKEIPAAQRKFPAGFRFQAQEDFLLPPNLNLIHGLADVRSSDAMFPSNYFYWINEVGGINKNEVFYDFYPRYYTRLNEKALNSDGIKAIGLSYLITEKPFPLKSVFTFKTEVGGIYIYQRSQNCGLIYYHTGDDISCDLSIDVKKTREDKIVFRLAHYENTDEKVVVINTLDYPGWVIKDKETGSEMRRTNISLPLTAFHAKPGATNYEAKFVPVSFRLGLWLSIATFIFAIIFTGTHFFKKSSVSNHITSF